MSKRMTEQQADKLLKALRLRYVPTTLNFEKVDIFLRVKGRLPDAHTDRLTKQILDEFCRKYEAGDLTEGIVPLEYLYRLIKNGDIKAKEEES